MDWSQMSNWGFPFCCTGPVTSHSQLPKCDSKRKYFRAMKCWLCNEFMIHLVSGCPFLAQTAYLKWHDGIACCFYYRLHHACGFDSEVHPWYDPEHIQGENDSFKHLWNSPIYSLRWIPANKPDLVLFDKASELIYITEFSVPLDINVTGKI